MDDNYFCEFDETNRLELKQVPFQPEMCDALIVRERGLKDGDVIELEFISRGKVRGPLKLIEGQHPQEARR